MTASSKYFDQARLLMDVLPNVRKEASLVLTGLTNRKADPVNSFRCPRGFVV